METYSFSKIDRFATCPRSYYHKYVEGLEEAPSKELESGKAVHEVIAGYLRGEGTDLAALAKRAVSSSTLLSEEDEKKIVGLAENFLDRYRPTGRILVEEKLEADIDGVRFLGYADLIEFPEGAPPVITDFKSGWDQYGPLDTMQLPLYAWMLSSRDGGGPVSVRLWFLPRKKDPVRQAVITPDLQRAAVEWVREKAAEIREAESFPGYAGFPARPGRFCKYCGAAAACLEIEGAESKDPSELAGLALRLERALDGVKAALKSVIAETGRPVECNGEWFYNWPKSSWKFPDVREFMDLVESVGEDPWDYVAVDGFKLKKLLWDPLIGKKIREMGEEKKSTYFGHRSNPPSEEE